MDGFLGILIHGADHVLVDGLRHEGDEGCCTEDGILQCGEQGHVGIDLVLLHTLGPETLTAPSYIPVGEVVHKYLQSLAGLRDPVLGHVGIHIPDHGVHLGEDPAVHNPKLLLLQGVFHGIEAVDICIKDIEGIGVPQGAQELSLAFRYCLSVETVGQPGGGVGIEIPADGVCTVLIQGLHGIHRIAL